MKMLMSRIRVGLGLLGELFVVLWSAVLLFILIVIAPVAVIVWILSFFFHAEYNVRNRCICGHGKAVHAWFSGRCYKCDCEEYEEDR